MTNLSENLMNTGYLLRTTKWKEILGLGRMRSEAVMMYQHGDIAGVPGHSILGKLNKRVFWPPTDLFHFLLIADYIPHENDYVILESVNKGIAVGRLSWYEGKGYRVFRPNIPRSQYWGRRACQALTQHGRAKYDYLLILKLITGSLLVWAKQLIKEGRLHRIRAVELPYARDSRFICTEAANEAWHLVGYPIVPKGMVPLPSAFIEALSWGELIELR